MDAGAGGESKDSDSEPSTFQREIPPWARGEGLRKVEKDVLIPRIMREKAKVLCKEFVDEFTKCAKGRTLSMVWACRDQNNAMKKCLESRFFDPEFFEECKRIYLKDRDNFQHEWQETGRTKRMQKKHSVIP